MTAPAAWLFEDNDELKELSQYLEGIDLSKPMSDGELDALASDLLARLARVQADLARYEEAEAAEMARITARYEQITEPLAGKASALEEAVKEIAKRAAYPGKAKSRKVGFGVYGKRSKAEKVIVFDEAEAIATLKKHCPEAVRIKEEIEMKVAKAFVLEQMKPENGGVIPAGFDHEEAKENYYADPFPAAQ